MFENGLGKENMAMGANMRLIENANWNPKWRIEKYNKNMKFYDVEEFEGNLLLNEGITALLKLLIGSSEKSFNNTNAYIGVGDGTTSASATQTGLVGKNKSYAPMDAGYPKIEENTVIFRATFNPDNGNHAWREFTVANGNSNSAKNLNRKVESALRKKVAPDTWVIQLQITIS